MTWLYRVVNKKFSDIFIRRKRQPESWNQWHVY